MTTSNLLPWQLLSVRLQCILSREYCKGTERKDEFTDYATLLALLESKCWLGWCFQNSQMYVYVCEGKHGAARFAGPAWAVSPPMIVCSIIATCLPRLFSNASLLSCKSPGHVCVLLSPFHHASFQHPVLTCVSSSRGTPDCEEVRGGRGWLWTCERLHSQKRLDSLCQSVTEGHQEQGHVTKLALTLKDSMG